WRRRCFFSSRRRHTRCLSDWSSDVCSSDLFHLSWQSADAALDPVERRLRHQCGDFLHPSDQWLSGELGSLISGLRVNASPDLSRSEERRVGKGWTCRWVWGPVGNKI